MVSKSPLMDSFVAGKKGILTCHVAGDPIPSITWFKNGVPIGPSRRYKYQDNKALLTVLSVQPHDSGIFTCLAENKYGQLNSSTNINVVGKY